MVACWKYSRLGDVLKCSPLAPPRISICPTRYAIAASASQMANRCGIPNPDALASNRKSRAKYSAIAIPRVGVKKDVEPWVRYETGFPELSVTGNSGAPNLEFRERI